MSTYAIGDVQGCYKTLKCLLKRIDFDPDRDTLWFAGDLINRGPKSLDVLRFVKDLGKGAVSVMGNHEIYLLALYYGILSREDTASLDPILKAKDAQDLVDWVQNRPLMHVSKGKVLVHAGLLPVWTVQEAKREAKHIEQLLRGPQMLDFLLYAYTHQESVWREDLRGLERHAMALHAFVHMRLCAKPNVMKFGYSGTLEQAPKGTKAWYQFGERRSQDHQILFGHWSALGLRSVSNCVALDSGCIWGGALSAYRIEDGAIFVEASTEG